MSNFSNLNVKLGYRSKKEAAHKFIKLVSSYDRYSYRIDSLIEASLVVAGVNTKTANKVSWCIHSTTLWPARVHTWFMESFGPRFVIKKRRYPVYDATHLADYISGFASGTARDYHERRMNRFDPKAKRFKTFCYHFDSNLSRKLIQPATTLNYPHGATVLTTDDGWKWIATLPYEYRDVAAIDIYKAIWPEEDVSDIKVIPDEGTPESNDYYEREAFENDKYVSLITQSRGTLKSNLIDIKMSWEGDVLTANVTYEGIYPDEIVSFVYTRPD